MTTIGLPISSIKGEMKSGNNVYDYDIRQCIDGVVATVRQFDNKEYRQHITLQYEFEEFTNIKDAEDWIITRINYWTNRP